MNIARIYLENLRSIERLDLDLRAGDHRARRRVILLGGNGCGKTTALAAIVHVLGAEGDARGNELGGMRLTVDDIRQDASDPARARMAFDVALSSRDRQWWKQYSPSEPGAPPESGTVRYVLGAPHHGRVNSGVWSGGDCEENQVDRDTSRILHILGSRHEPPAVYLPADRGTLQASEGIRVDDVSDFWPGVNCLSSSRERFRVVPALLALAQLAPEQNDRDGAVARMWKVLAKYFPEMPRPIGVHRFRMLWRTQDGATVEMPQLSDGQRAVLLIFGELAVRNPRGGIVLIDELEQHLHPRWQRVILDALVALLPDTQFIITTQAPYLAAAAPDDVKTLGDWSRDGPQ